MRRRFIVVTAVVWLAATTVSGQAPPSAAKAKLAASKAWTPPRTPDGQPDLQGIWSKKFITPRQRPTEFAGKEFFTEQEAAEFERRVNQANANRDRRGDTPEQDVGGMGDVFPDGVSGLPNDLPPGPPKLDKTRRTSLIVDPPDGRRPALTPEAQKGRVANQARSLHADGPEDRTLEERCMGRGLPLTFLGPGNDPLIQILQAPGYVLLLVERYREVRIIPLDGRPHLPQNMHRWEGDSRGRWEGNTLVVDTTNFTERKPMPNFGSPEGSSENLHFIERFTRTDPDTLLHEFTVDDPAVYTKPWTAQIPLGKREGPIFEDACHEGNYALADILTGARFAEKTGAIISGRIHDAAGQPLSNINVEARAVAYTYSTYGYTSFKTAAATTTDDRGEYQLFPVPPGEYYLGATRPPTPASAGTAPGPQTVTTFYPGETAVTAATPVVIRGGEALIGMDIEMRTPAGFKLSGQVTSLVSQPAPAAGRAGTPATPQAAVTVATLAIVARDVNVPDGVRGVGSVPLDPSTGKFEITNILPGTYDVYARVNDLQNWLAGGAPFAYGRTPIEVRDRDVDGLAIVIHSGVEVKGTVTSSGSRVLQTNVQVALQPTGSSAKNPPYQDVAQRPATASQDGSFTIPAVPEGRFRVEPQGLPPDDYVADVRQGGVSVYDSGVEVGTVPPGPIQVLVNSGAGTIQGTVHDGAGNPVLSATVVLVPELKRRQNRTLYSAATSDSMGNFTIKGIAPGEYTLFAWEERVWSGAYQNPGFIAKYEARGRSIKVAEASTVAAEVTAIPAPK